MLENAVADRGRLKDGKERDSTAESAFSTPDSLALSAELDATKYHSLQPPGYVCGVRQREEYLQQQIKLRNHRIADITYQMRQQQIDATEAWTKVELLDLTVATERQRANTLEIRMKDALQRLAAEKEAAQLAYAYCAYALAEQRVTQAKLYQAIEERDAMASQLIDQIALQQNYQWTLYENRRLLYQLACCADEKLQARNVLCDEVQLRTRNGFCDEKELSRWAQQRALAARGDEAFAEAAAQFKLAYGAIARGLEQQAAAENQNYLQ